MTEMQKIKINEKISYIEASDYPLSADIGIIRENGSTWLFDVGNGEKSIVGLNDGYHIVLSHFHEDHIGNIDRLRAEELFVSKLTFEHVHRGTIITDDLSIGGLRIFPFPSSHTSGCLGLEVDQTYAFVGDGLYCRVRNGRYIYNTQLLQEEIAVLKNLHAPFLLVSHFSGLVRRREEVIAELEMIYSMRDKNKSEIVVTKDQNKENGT